MTIAMDTYRDQRWLFSSGSVVTSVKVRHANCVWYTHRSPAVGLCLDGAGAVQRVNKTPQKRCTRVILRRNSTPNELHETITANVSARCATGVWYLLR